MQGSVTDARVCETKKRKMQDDEGYCVRVKETINANDDDDADDELKKRKEFTTPTRHREQAE
jgi:hypothetical protein